MAATRGFLIVLFALFIGTQPGFASDEDTTNKDGHRIRTVVIDAGHGGKDVGCVGSNGYEKDVVLGIALKLGGYIEESLPDVEVIYTRKKDVFVPLDERAQIANKNDADIFISIHANAAGSSSAHGTETWVMGSHKSEDNLKVAKRENAVITMEDDYQEKYEYDPNSPVSHIVFSIKQYANQDQSIDLAQGIQDQFRERAQRHDRGVKQAGFVVLFKTTMPSVLIESGFMTNRNEEKFLRSNYGQEIIASAIFRGFRNYKEQVEAEYLALNPPSKEDPSQPDKEATVEQEPPSPEKEASTEKKEEASKQPGGSESEVDEDKGNVEIRVQIFASTTLSDVDNAPFNELDDVYTDQTKGGIFRYFYGSYYDYEKAKQGLEEAKEAGFEDAFLAAYKNGKRVDMPETIAISE